MEISQADFMELTINEVSDLLLNDIHENDKEAAGALLCGVDDTGRKYCLKVTLEVEND